MSKKEDITLLRMWEFENEQDIDIEIIRQAFSDLFKGIATSYYLSEPGDFTRSELGIANLPAISICSGNDAYMTVHITTYYERKSRVVVMGIIGKGEQIKAAELESFYTKCFGSVSAFTNAIKVGNRYGRKIGGSSLAGGIGAGVGFAIGSSVKLAAKGVKALLRDKEAYEKEMDFYRFAMSAGDFVLGGVDSRNFAAKLGTQAKGGNLTAQYLLGVAYDEGRGVAVDHNEAIKWFDQAAAGGEKRSRVILISEYLFGDAEYDAECIDKGLRYLKEQADDGEAWAVDALLAVYDKGTVRGIDKDIRKAQEMAAAYVQFENVYAAMLVANAYDTYMCEGAFLKNDEKAAFLYGKIAEKGDEEFAPEAALYLGKMYKDGRGVPQDVSKAVSYFETAAKAGMFEAKTELVYIYTFGNGVMPDYPTARRLCDELINSGDFAHAALGKYCRYYIADKEEKYRESLQYARAYLESDTTEPERANEVRRYIEEKEKLLESMTEQERNEYLKIEPPKTSILEEKKIKIVSIVLICVVALVAAYFLLFLDDDKPMTTTGTEAKEGSSYAVAIETKEDEEALPKLFYNGVTAVKGANSYKLIDEEGNQLAALEYSWVGPFSESGKAIASDSNSEKYGIIDSQGAPVCEFKYDSIWLSDNGELLPACIDNMWGYINWDGEEVIPFQFQLADNFEENGLAGVVLNGQGGYINQNGEMELVIDGIFSNDGERMPMSFAKNGLACVIRDGKYGYIDATGEYVIPPQYDYATDFDDFSRAVVTLDGKQGIIDSDGNYILDCEYDMVGDLIGQGAPRSFDDYGYCRITNYDSGTALINTEGEFICSFDYVRIGDFCRNGLAPVGIAVEGDSTRAAFINTKNEIVLSTDYEFAGTFSPNGLALVEKNEKYGYINMDGEEVIPLQYEYAGAFSRYGLSVVLDETTVYVINEQGESLCSVPFPGFYCPWETELTEYDSGYTVVALHAMDPNVESRTFIFKNETLIYDSKNR